MSIDKLKIIFAGDYNPDEILTGPEKVAKRVFANLNLQTESAFVEYFTDGTKYSVWQKLFGKEEIQVTDNAKVLRLGLFRTILFVFQFKPKIVHIISYQRFSVIFFLLKYFLQFKISYTVHGIIVHENQNFRKNTKKSLALKDKVAERIIFKFSDRLFFLSEQSKQMAESYYKFSRTKIAFISNGIDEIFHKKFLNRNYVRKEKLNVLVIADFFRPEKGLEFFMEAIAPIQSQFNFTVIGTGIETTSVQINFISKMSTNEFAALLKEQDIFISTSSFDTFPLVTIEAMAAGVLPVISITTGVSKYIINGENGFIFTYGNIDELRSILLKINNQPELVFQLATNASRIYDKLNWKLVSNKYLGEFNELINER